MRKNLLIIIPSIILLILSAIFITISIVVITNKKKGISIVKATEVVEEDNFEFTYDNVTYYCHNVKKDKKNNFIIEEGGFIKIKSPKHDIIGFNNGDKLNVLLEGNNVLVVKLAKKIRAQLLEDPDLFEELAEKYSLQICRC